MTQARITARLLIDGTPVGMVKEFSSPSSATTGLASYDLEGQRSKPRRQRLAELRETQRKLKVKKSVDNAIHVRAATGPYNLKPLPSEARLKAGNYAKGHVKIAGIDIAIENPAGSRRRPEWPELKSHYGYIKRTVGADGDQVDCFVRVGTPRSFTGNIYIINQFDHRRIFDEHKVMVGWYTEETARAAYLANYSRGWTGLGTVKVMSIPEFKQWLKHGDTERMAKADEAAYESFVTFFMGRLATTIQTTKAKYSRLVAKGDAAGHEFHGNQWTGGQGGAAPTETTATEKSKALKELMASGHQFTVSQISKITGASSTYVSKTLKGMVGVDHKGLTVTAVQKEGSSKTYYVVKPIASMHNPDVPEPSKGATLTAKPESTATVQVAASIKPTGPAKNLATDADQHPYDKGGHVMQAPEAAMSKAEADNAYNATRLQANDALLAAAKEAGQFQYGSSTYIGKMAEALESWKSSRADAMAQWKANTTGTDQKVGAQQIFAADKALFNTLASGGSFAKAIGQWKNDTAAEKMGTFGKQPAAPKSEASGSQTATVSGPLPSTKGEAIQPIPSSKQIGVNDFKAAEGQAKTPFEKLFTKTAGAFKDEGKKGDSVSNKQEIEKQLNAQLAGSKAFQEMEKNTAAKGQYSLAGRLVSNWAATSNDHDPMAVALQLAVRDEFGMSKNDVDMNRGQDTIDKHGESGVYQQAAAKIGYKGDMATFRQGLMDFQRAQYDVTQQYLASKGITELALVRGMKVGNQYDPVEKVNVILQPSSSFTHAYSTAKTFSGGHNIFMVKVPASSILGSYKTGFGCTNESEVVVLASKNMESIRIGSHKAAGIKEAVASVQQHMSQWKDESQHQKMAKASAVRMDNDQDNADWLKQSWDLPPYKSVEFLIVFPDLDVFRALPVYQWAEDQGLILDDEWMGEVVSVPAGRDGARVKAVTPSKSNGGLK